LEVGALKNLDLKAFNILEVEVVLGTWMKDLQYSEQAYNYRDHLCLVHLPRILLYLFHILVHLLEVLLI